MWSLLSTLCHTEENTHEQIVHRNFSFLFKGVSLPSSIFVLFVCNCTAFIRRRLFRPPLRSLAPSNQWISVYLKFFSISSEKLFRTATVKKKIGIEHGVMFHNIYLSETIYQIKAIYELTTTGVNQTPFPGAYIAGGMHPSNNFSGGIISPNILLLLRKILKVSLFIRLMYKRVDTLD